MSYPGMSTLNSSSGRRAINWQHASRSSSGCRGHGPSRITTKQPSVLRSASVKARYARSGSSRASPSARSGSGLHWRLCARFQCSCWHWREQYLVQQHRAQRSFAGLNSHCAHSLLCLFDSQAGCAVHTATLVLVMVLQKLVDRGHARSAERTPFRFCKILSKIACFASR